MSILSTPEVSSLEDRADSEASTVHDITAGEDVRRCSDATRASRGYSESAIAKAQDFAVAGSAKFASALSTVKDDVGYIGSSCIDHAKDAVGRTKQVAAAGSAKVGSAIAVVKEEAEIYAGAGLARAENAFEHSKTAVSAAVSRTAEIAEHGREDVKEKAHHVTEVVRGKASAAVESVKRKVSGVLTYTWQLMDAARHRFAEAVVSFRGAAAGAAEATRHVVDVGKEKAVKWKSVAVRKVWGAQDVTDDVATGLENAAKSAEEKGLAAASQVRADVASAVTELGRESEKRFDDAKLEGRMHSGVMKDAEGVEVSVDDNYTDEGQYQSQQSLPHLHSDTTGSDATSGFLSRDSSEREILAAHCEQGTVGTIWHASPDLYAARTRVAEEENVARARFAAEEGVQRGRRASQAVSVSKQQP